MLNDRDEKHEGHEESEYHFSDDEVSYEVETESPKAAAPGEPKENVFNRLTRSKRMLISLGVFLVLVFVVYKMVSPTSTPAPGTDITAAPAIAQQSAMPKTLTPPAPPKAVAPTPPPAAAPATAVAAAQPAAPDVQAIQPPVMQTPVAPAPAVAPSVAQPAAAMPSAVTPTNTAVAATMPAQPTAAPAAVTPTQPAMPQQPVAQMTAPAPTPPAALPSASPTTAALPATPTTTTVTSVQSSTSTSAVPSSTAMGAQVPGTVETKITNVASANDKMLDQLEAEYSQKLNDYMTQNKALQDQVQTLNSRVASMETQMNQLIQALTHQGGGNNVAAPSQPPPVAAVEVKAAYNVQAIIPGRAWLRADNGETVTVAEGDMIKDLGRVTKIDPYDGVVEINTGNKVISLSYGSGG